MPDRLDKSIEEAGKGEIGINLGQPFKVTDVKNQSLVFGLRSELRSLYAASLNKGYVAFYFHRR